jgi:ABC-2 type transport system permease protein
MRKRLFALLKKEYAQMIRDKALLFILVWSFTVSPFIAANGLSMEVHHHPFVIYDQSQSVSSRELTGRLQEPYFRLLTVLNSDREIIDYLDRGTASMAIIIPADFERQIVSGKAASFQVISDGSISLSATVAAMYVSQICADYTMELLEHRGLGPLIKQNIPQVNSDLRTEYNPNRISSWFMGLVDFISQITIISLLLPAAAMVREKEFGTIEQLMVTPARSIEIFLSKIIPNVLVILPLSFVGLYGVMKGFFELPINGNLLMFYMVMTLYIFVMTSLGIQVALLAKNLPQVIMIIILLLIPMIFLSGTFTPPEAMPIWMQRVGLLIPMRYFLEFTFDVLLKGNSFADVWPNMLGLLIIGSSLFASSCWMFYRQFSK